MLSNHQRIRGLCAAVHTPLSSDGSKLNLNIVEVHAKSLQASGIKYVLVAGTTGESMKLSIEERKSLTEKWIEIGNKYEIKVYVHVGHDSISNAQELTAHAQKFGAAGVVAMPPIFFKPGTLKNLVRVLAEIAKYSPSLPFYYYHFPQRTGVTHRMIDLLIEIDSSKLIPNFVGMKFTDYDLFEMSECIQYKRGKYEILFGKDEILTSALVIGCEGAIGSTYNFTGRLMNQVLSAYEKGDLSLAQELLIKEQQIVSLYRNFPGKNPEKAIMKMKGIDVGPPRLPTEPLNEEEYNYLEKELRKIGGILD